MLDVTVWLRRGRFHGEISEALVALWVGSTSVTVH